MNRIESFVRRLLPLLMLALLPVCQGCFMFGGDASVRYSVGTPRTHQVEAEVSGITVRMADDLRTARTPLRFRADGTVTRVPGLTYYAPVEVVLGRALREMIGVSGNRRAPVADLMVADFCVDETGAAPCVRVTLVRRETGRAVCETRPVADGTDAAEVRKALAEALTAAAVRVMR